MNTVFSPENLQMLSSISVIGFAFVFLIGLVMAFNPRSVMIIPVIMGYIAGRRGDDDPAGGSLSRAFAFVLGMTVADVMLGVLFAYIGGRVSLIFGPKWEVFIGVVLIILGLRWLNLFRFRTVGFEMKGRKARSLAGAFFLGLPFSMSFCPFCIPILLTILTIAAATGHVWYSAALMVFFSLGRGLPLLVAGVSIGLVKRLSFFQRYVPAFEKFGGILLLVMGGYYIYDFVSIYLAAM